jgi:hypothetical protein
MFFKFRMLYESGNNFAKFIEISLLQGCVSIPYRYINSASQKLWLFSMILVPMYSRLTLKPWRLTLGPWGLIGAVEEPPGALQAHLDP